MDIVKKVFEEIKEFIHNIIQFHNNVMWDWQYSTKYSSYSYLIWEMFYIILSVQCSIVMDMNNVMLYPLIVIILLGVIKVSSYRTQQ